ncbi:hypothetical protein HU830_03010 [Lactobacillus sp. DCY120]|uniref:Phage-Barnase-EndoU-ColicinE5/D-RelE like nuclease 4 domain-containing protein n=1 Tax=Bombilactobacillus apium TaxID=2675299 RepID=A0A850R2A3_9LACO|nr:PBECR4 domain-containing protein [Bombilactobacillus apium]NVY96151.1 hypothetical protein [Bombilactobacillus apium]
MYQAALMFNPLLDKQIILRLGHKRKIYDVTITFDPSDFRHLAGLHKLKDRPKVSKQGAREVFREIINMKITFNDISKSDFCPFMEERLVILSELKQIFDGNDSSFAYKFLGKSRKLSYSRISWKYLLEFKDLSGKIGYLF